MTISIAICTRNRYNDLIECLNCVKAQNTLPDQLILVEDVSDQQYFTLKKLKDFFIHTTIECKYIATTAQVLSASRNLAIRHAHSDIVLFIDDDVIISDDLINKYKKLHKNYPHAIGFVGRVLPFSDDVYSKFGSWYSNGELSNKKKMTVVEHFAGSTFSLNRRRFLRHKIWYKEDWKAGEDLDVFIRLYEKGERLYFHPSIQTHHKYKTDLASFFKKHVSYARYFGVQALTHPKYFSIDEYIPNKLKQWLLLPLFMVRSSYNHAYYLVKDKHIDKELFIPAFFSQLASFYGVYTSREGRDVLFRKLFSLR